MDITGNPISTNSRQRPLDILGIGAMEEEVYRWLLAHSGATVSEIAQALTQAPGKTQRLLASIEDKGLVTRLPERPRRYVPASPGVALEACALRRQEDLRHARAAIQELQGEVAATAPFDAHAEMVELITSREAERQTYEQMHRAAQEEVVGLVRPPLLISRLDTPLGQDHAIQRAAQARGVRYRGIVDAEFLELPGALNIVREEMKTGQEIRVTPELPFKMILSDRRIAIVPLNLEEPHSPVLLVRSSALLNALYALFEILWKQATPIAFTRNDTWKTSEALEPLPEETEDLVSLLAAGLKDKSIARELGISASTLNRHITGIMRALNARTRFQLGWLADRYLAQGRESSDGSATVGSTLCRSTAHSEDEPENHLSAVSGSGDASGFSR